MQFLVSKNKTDGSLFIETRGERETRISVLLDLGSWIPSVVLKGFESYEEALIYKQEQERVDGIIGDLFLN